MRLIQQALTTAFPKRKKAPRPTPIPATPQGKGVKPLPRVPFRAPTSFPKAPKPAGTKAY